MGRVANLASGLKRTKTQIAKEIELFNTYFVIVALILGWLFFIIALFTGYHWVKCIILFISIIVANVPEGKKI